MWCLWQSSTLAMHRLQPRGSQNTSISWTIEGVLCLSETKSTIQTKKKKTRFAPHMRLPYIKNGRRKKKKFTSQDLGVKEREILKPWTTPTKIHTISPISPNPKIVVRAVANHLKRPKSFTSPTSPTVKKWKVEDTLLPCFVNPVDRSLISKTWTCKEEEE